jgi:hypothetical protein
MMALIAVLWTWLSQTYATIKSLAHAMPELCVSALFACQLELHAVRFFTL